MFLRKKKIKHSSAKDGQEAIEKWRTGGFHLILVSGEGVEICGFGVMKVRPSVPRRRRLCRAKL